MPMRLRTLLGDHPCTAALKNGSVKSDLVEFDFVQYSPTNKGFKPMVREGAFDVSEMAIVTYLMAKSFAKPMVLLPDVVLARFQHAHALYNAKAGKLAPRDLNGKRIGYRHIEEVLIVDKFAAGLSRKIIEAVVLAAHGRGSIPVDAIG